jgi:hypothetical protein
MQRGFHHGLLAAMVVNVPRRTETNETPGDPGARRENIGLWASHDDMVAWTRDA